MDRPVVNDPAIAAYTASHSTAPDEVQEALIAATAERVGELSIMQISPLQGTFMSVLAAAVRPALAIEIGTFTGYSSLAVARALPPGGRLLCCDISEEWTDIAREHWEQAGVADRVELRIGPAIDTLRSLPTDTPVDLAFVYADKTGYLDYYEELLPRLSPHGVLLVDNTLWSGAVLDPEATDDSTVALRAFNDHVAADPRSEVALLPIGDGVSFIRRSG